MGRLSAAVRRAASTAFLAVCVACALSAGPASARTLIGVTLVEHRQAPAEIQRVRAGYPASAAGLRAGDLILEVNGVAPIGAEAAARAITSTEDGPTQLQIRREREVFEITILPWSTPNPALDEALFPYPDPAPVGSTLRARIAERDYEVVTPNAVFTLSRSIGSDRAMLGRRVAFRARVMNCDVVSGAPPALYQPSSSPLYEFRPIQSLLFDPVAAEEERAKCDRYMRANGLDLSSPIVVVAGRFVLDEERVFSHGGPVLLVDAMLFDNNHVSLGAQVVGFVDVVERFVSTF